MNAAMRCGIIKAAKKKDMPHFTSQDRPKKVKDIYRALKREHPDMPAEMKARIAARQGKKGKQHQGPPYKGPLTPEKGSKKEAANPELLPIPQELWDELSHSTVPPGKRYVPGNMNYLIRLTPEEQEKKAAFKVGFMLRLAQRGLTPSDVEKLAMTKMSGLGGAVTGVGREALRVAGGGLRAGLGMAQTVLDRFMETTGRWGPVVLLGAPALGGAMLGMIHAKLTSPSAIDVDDYRKQELIDMYTRAAEEARRRVKGIKSAPAPRSTLY